ncbi:MAG: RusA family crossover junction endodeoxyribonuclease [Desulfurellales bacterium]|nr:MAG: RusA family crossover junction endodeoxyribonuclease [Desulfurellales bacterium]
MNRRIEFEVYGEPKGQPRARACIRGQHAAVYDPGTADAWKFAVRAAAKDAAGAAFVPFSGPVMLDLDVWIQRPKGHYSAAKTGGIKASAPMMPTGKPDCDNLAKAILDALTNAGIWLDDKQVTHLQVRKIYNTRGGARIVVEGIE